MRTVGHLDDVDTLGECGCAVANTYAAEVVVPLDASVGHQGSADVDRLCAADAEQAGRLYGAEDAGSEEEDRRSP